MPYNIVLVSLASKHATYCYRIVLATTYCYCNALPIATVTRYLLLLLHVTYRYSNALPITIVTLTYRYYNAE